MSEGVDMKCYTKGSLVQACHGFIRDNVRGLSSAEEVKQTIAGMNTLPPFLRTPDETETFNSCKNQWLSMSPVFITQILKENLV
jgi:phage/plasmid primase-like uncharacterized protein